MRQPQPTPVAPTGAEAGGDATGFDPLGLVPQPLVTQPPVSPTVEFPNPAGMAGGESAPNQTGVAPTPTNPFGIPFGSSATPGIVTPVPSPQQQPPQPTPNGVQ